MKTLTIRGVDRVLFERLRRESRRGGMSINRFVLRCLERVLGSKKTGETYRDLDHLFGRWGEGEAKAFRKAVATFESIESELWKS